MALSICTRGSPILLLAACLALSGCPAFPDPPFEDTGPPTISGIDGDGTERSVDDVAGLTDDVTHVENAPHRFRNAWIVSGTYLDTLTDATLVPSGEGEPLTLEIEQGGTNMQRTLLLPATLYAGAFVLTLTNPYGQATAQTYVLQGEAGISCWDTNQNGLDDDLDVNGDGILDVQDCVKSTVCPAGYEVQSYSEAGGAICENPLTGDQMVQLGDFWIDRYEVSLWGEPECTGNQYGIADDDAHTAGFNHNTIWSTPLYACSVEDEEPARWINWFQAVQACELAGKSLCTNTQWQAAAAGTPVLQEACNVDAADSENTGTHADCESVWGALDMVGNVWEWVTGWHQVGPTDPDYMHGTEAVGVWGTEFGEDSTWNINGRANGDSGYTDGLPGAPIRGGDWNHSTASGLFAINLSHAPTDSGNYLGFRCCRQD